MQLIQDKKQELEALCKKYKVAELYIFGSVLTDSFNWETSDIDFLVFLEPLSPIERGEALMGLWMELEELFSRKVDLLTDTALANPFLRDSIENSKQLIYDRKSQKIFS